VATHQSKLVFEQVIAQMPLSTLRRCVAHYGGEYEVKSRSTLDQFYSIASAELTFRESLRDIEACLATWLRPIKWCEFIAVRQGA